MDMFLYDELTIEEKEIILILGSCVLSRAQEAGSNLRNRLQIYESKFKGKYTKEVFEETLLQMYYKGLVAFDGSCGTKRIDNTAINAKDMLEKQYFEVQKQWREQSNWVRLTWIGERTIPGEQVYFEVYQELTNKHYAELNDKMLQAAEDLKEIRVLKETLDNQLLKNIEIIGVFVAVFGLLIGNIQVFELLKTTNVMMSLGLVLCINGTLILGIVTLLGWLSKIAFVREKKLENIWGFYLMPTVLLILGSVAIIIEKL